MGIFQQSLSCEPSNFALRSKSLKLLPVDVPADERFRQLDISVGIGFRYVHKGFLQIPTTSQMGSPFVSINTFKHSSTGDGSRSFMSLLRQALLKLAL